jgi:hypothetical protein
MEAVELKLSGRGRRAFKHGLDGLAPETMLVMEIMTRLKHVREDNLADLCLKLIARCGSAENAITAVKAGIVGFHPADDSERRF